MELLLNDWIRVGSGNLYCPPFLSRFLLFRLYESGCCMLISHDSVGSTSNVTNDGIVTTLATIRFPKMILVHVCSKSATEAVDYLLKLPVKQFQLSESKATVGRLDSITFRIELYSLPFLRTRLVTYQNEKVKPFDIQGSSYRVVGPVDACKWPSTICLGEAGLRCWRVFVNDAESLINYDVTTSRHWSLTAMDVDEGGQFVVKAHLENRMFDMAVVK